MAGAKNLLNVQTKPQVKSGRRLNLSAFCFLSKCHSIYFCKTLEILLSPSSHVTPGWTGDCGNYRDASWLVDLSRGICSLSSPFHTRVELACILPIHSSCHCGVDINVLFAGGGGVHDGDGTLPSAPLICIVLHGFKCVSPDAEAVIGSDGLAPRPANNRCFAPNGREGCQLPTHLNSNKLDWTCQ